MSNKAKFGTVLTAGLLGSVLLSSFDLSAFFSATIGGVPMFLFVMLVVEAFKMAGLKGQPLFYVSLAAGTAVGVLYQLTQLVPVTLADWMAVIFFGLTLGFVAAGVWDAYKAKTQELAETQAQKTAVDLISEAPGKGTPDQLG